MKELVKIILKKFNRKGGFIFFSYDIADAAWFGYQSFCRAK
ncbi:MAG TPA: hypothetical protein VN451_00435 [Chitinophagaceae bacterium]|nr:hypothetical protein [Chitinophagaceae bacterium]